MTLIWDGGAPWDLFQARIKAAICRASDEHEVVGGLLIDLWLCEMSLRASGESLDGLRSPAARELQSALDAHATEDPYRFDEIYAANVVQEALNAIATTAADPDP